MKEAKCPTCGKIFLAKKHRFQDGKIPVCSRQCRIVGMDHFWERVTKADGCWICSGRPDKFGYKKANLNKRQQLAHRVSWQLSFGPIPDGLCVLHKCDNPPCVRPDHLFLGTKADVQKDAASKNRLPHGEDRPDAKLTVEAVMEIRKSVGVYQRVLAGKFGVSQSLISLVKHKKVWRHTA